jgi:hypothetical protein
LESSRPRVNMPMVQTMLSPAMAVTPLWSRWRWQGRPACWKPLTTSST